MLARILKRLKFSASNWPTSAKSFRLNWRKRRKPCAARLDGEANKPVSPYDAKKLTARVFGRMLRRDYEGLTLELDFAAQTQARDLGGWAAVGLHGGRFPGSTAHHPGCGGEADFQTIRPRGRD